MTNSRGSAINKELKNQAIILGTGVALMWVFEIIDFFVFQGSLNRFGIRPRDIQGLWGILFVPFLHGDFNHLMGNTVPFLTLGWLVMLQETSDFFIVTAIVMVVSGLGTWLTGSPDSIHIGASGVVFGYLGFLLFRGYFLRNVPSIVVSIIVGVFYGSFIWGVLPLKDGVSWEGHLFGFIGGAIAAKFLSSDTRTKNSKQ
ncbi:MAG: rhomboid family intramembrane serine protease [Coleofasciculaceae cyanobacterium SM2_1_6]|nr:rhomboid family intramembrane serine protease [Coleofasciculaceae cyanobacterium SM2_1_6]